ncbi:MAG: ATP-binding protein [Propionibacteriaceae bacterium]|jgi:predicted AAA+ superfamily ATPase|nr:ATP-binding protein [Propionibacteriaceae bacterium]
MSGLLDWRASRHRKPLLLQGARQVGKTWLLREFGRRHYRACAYVNFESNPSIAGLFSGDIDLPRIISGLGVASGVDIVPEDTLVILDEIQECPRAVTALKYFAEDAPQYHIAGAGSLLGVALGSGLSFPVGKVDSFTVHPLSFAEFCAALGEDALLRVLAERDWDLANTFHERYVSLLRDYLCIGGMPEVVARFAANRSYPDARAAQNGILDAYLRDFAKHAPIEQVPRIAAVWESVPSQLGKQSGRFVYGQIASGARGRQYEAALGWLVGAGLVHRVKRITAPRLPLSGYGDVAAFKLYAVDVGLLTAMTKLSAAVVLEGNRLFTEFKGALAEQYVCQELVAAHGEVPHYWTNGSGGAEVDFVVAAADSVIPVEVKAERNLKAKSLRVYREKYSPSLAVRTSLAPFADSGSLIDLPLYAVSTLGR